MQARGERLASAALGPNTCLLAGTLHNRPDLERQLGLTAAKDDPTVVLRAYERWGSEALKRLRGRFALIVFDGDAQSVVAARDPMGIYPLFFAETRLGVVLSNSIAELVARPDVPANVNLSALVDHLRHAWPYVEETYFDHVRRLPPGHALSTSGGVSRIWRYWDPGPSEAIEWVTAEEIPRFDELLQQAVERCQRDDRTAVFLSGGLDSVSIAAVATDTARARGLREPLALSLEFPDPDANETPVQRGVAATLGLEQVLMDWQTAVGPEGLVAQALELSALASTPLFNLWSPAYDRLARAATQRRLDTILTGTGGDEWLTVSPFYAADLLRRGDIRSLVRLFAHHSRSHQINRAHYLRNIFWRFGARPIVANAAKRHVGKLAPGMIERSRLRRLDRATSSWLAPDPRLRAAMRERALATVRRDLASRRVLDPPARSFPAFYVNEMRTALDHPLVALEFEEIFDQGRRLGVQIMSPYNDADLVAFLYRTPPEILNRGGRSKGLVRDAVDRRFPQLGFERQRKVTATGFGKSIVVTEGVKAFQKVQGGLALAEHGVVAEEPLKEHLNAVLRDPRGLPHVLWEVLTLEAWLRTNC